MKRILQYYDILKSIYIIRIIKLSYYSSYYKLSKQKLQIVENHDNEKSLVSQNFPWQYLQALTSSFNCLLPNSLKCVFYLLFILSFFAMLAFCKYATYDPWEIVALSFKYVSSCSLSCTNTRMFSRIVECFREYSFIRSCLKAYVHVPKRMFLNKWP